MKCMAVMNGLVFLKVVAYAAPNGKEFSNNARFGAQKEHCLTCFQLQLFKPNNLVFRCTCEMAHVA